MKPVIVAVALVATNAYAIDFDKEWSKFDSDFARLNAVKVAKYEAPKVERTQPSISTVPAPEIKKLPDMPSEENVLEQVDPKSPDRLGYKLSDPDMKAKVTNLYKKPDTVVYSLTLTE